MPTPPPPVSDLDSHLGYWLRSVSNHVSHAFRLKVESHGVTVAEWVLLRVLLGSEGVNPSHVAEQLGLTRGAVSKLVDRLVAKRLVRCRAEKKDRRFQTIRLTPAGSRMVPLLAALADENDRAFFGHLPAAQRDALKALLADLVERHGMHGTPIE